MTYYSTELLKEIKKIDLLTYLQNTNPSELVKVSNDTYS